jgi:hypothetical protein
MGEEERGRKGEGKTIYHVLPILILLFFSS